MPRERDKNRKLFHKGHYEVIAARFREQASTYAAPEFEIDNITDTIAAASLYALRDLANLLADRFEFDNDIFDRNIFLERCGFIL